MYEWYSYKLVEYRTGVGYIQDYQAIATITHARSKREVMLANDYSMKDDPLIFKGPRVDNFVLKGLPPELPKHFRRFPENWK